MSEAPRLDFTATLVGEGGNGDMLASHVVLPDDAVEAVAAYELHQRILTGKRRAFGSVKVEATVGDSQWSTSVFPQKDGRWLLPVKSSVRRAEGKDEGDDIAISLTLL